MADFSRLLFMDLPAATQLPIYSIHVSFKVISLEVSFLLTVVTLRYIFYDRILAIYYCMVVSHLINGLIAIFYWLIDWLIRVWFFWQELERSEDMDEKEDWQAVHVAVEDRHFVDTFRQEIIQQSRTLKKYLYENW